MAGHFYKYTEYRNIFRPPSLLFLQGFTHRFASFRSKLWDEDLLEAIASVHIYIQVSIYINPQNVAEFL